jgi:RNA polymerase sigma-70 factor (ECF subfamily)
MHEGMSDEALMLAYREGDAAAFEALYRRWRGRLYRTLLRQCGAAAQAEELFQDVWLKVVNARRGYEVAAKFSTWLFRIAHNRLIDHYRSQGRAEIASYDDDPEDADRVAALPAAPAAADAIEMRPRREALRKEAAGAARTPEQWLEEIRRLRREGREAEADAALAEFRKAHPDYRLPDDLR